MKKRDPALRKEQGRSGDRFARRWRQTRNAYHGARPQAKAQSEREKRGLRHSDFGVESSSRSFGVVTPPDGHFSAARLRPARSRKAWGQPGHIGRGCPSYAF